jgi:hypothetical protein
MTTTVRINVIPSIWTEKTKNEALQFESHRSNLQPMRPPKVGFHEKVDAIDPRDRRSGLEFYENIV